MVKRKKLRFSARKYRKRKKLELPVSIPLEVIEPLLSQDSQLVVSLRILAYTSAPVEDLACLKTRVESCDLLPIDWLFISDDEPGSSLSSLAFHKLAAGVVLTLEVTDDLAWQLQIGESAVEHSVELLQDCPLYIGCVDHILQLLSQLDEVIFSSDPRFLELLEPPLSQLVVSLPVSAYTSCPTEDIACLKARVESCGLLPLGWSLSDGPSLPSLMLHKLPDFGAAAGVVIILQVTDDCAWKLRIGESVIKPSIELLKDCPLHIGCVDQLLQLLSQLDDATCCVGNSDPIFLEFIDRRKGCIKDHSGEQVTSCCSWF